MGHLRCLKTILEPAGPLPGRISPEVARLNVRGRKAFPRLWWDPSSRGREERGDRYGGISRRQPLEADASIVAEYETRIAALERKVGQLTMELDLAKKTPRLRLVSDNESSSIITGPKPVPSEGAAK